MRRADGADRLREETAQVDLGSQADAAALVPLVAGELCQECSRDPRCPTDAPACRWPKGYTAVSADFAAFVVGAGEHIAAIDLNPV